MRNRSVTYSTGRRRAAPGQRALAAAPAAVFAALADPTRCAVLDLLRAGAQPAGQIARRFPVSRPAVSKHLRQLRRAHLVEEHRAGRQRLYRLNPEPLKLVDHWLESYRTFWSANLASLKAYVEANPESHPARRKRRRGDL
ncbi:MAG TPA: metalloregulator ArsR/SmtB family transcription factor [Terriglobales bacterium]|nr:metalloregulator ArsR/SmtB family transcription factor [Terriglobales bacterium]